MYTNSNYGNKKISYDTIYVQKVLVVIRVCALSRSKSVLPRAEQQRGHRQQQRQRGRVRPRRPAAAPEVAVVSVHYEDTAAHTCRGTTLSDTVTVCVCVRVRVCVCVCT